MIRSKEKIYRNQGNVAILDQIEGQKLEILDLGCGGGTFEVLAALGNSIDGVTISEKEKHDKAGLGRDIVIHNLEQGIPEELTTRTYDYILCSHVLEHICYPEKLLNDIKVCLKEGGLLLVALPNIMHYKARLKLLRGIFKYEESGLWDYTHFRWYTYQTSRELLVTHGFVVAKHWVTGDLPFASFLKKMLPQKTYQKTYGMLAKLSPGLFGYQIVLSAKCKK